MTASPSPMLRGRGTGPRSEYFACCSGSSSGMVTPDAEPEQPADDRFLGFVRQAADPKRLSQGHGVRQGAPHDGVGERFETAADEHVQRLVMSRDYVCDTGGYLVGEADV